MVVPCGKTKLMPSVKAQLERSTAAAPSFSISRYSYCDPWGGLYMISLTRTAAEPVREQSRRAPSRVSAALWPARSANTGRIDRMCSFIPRAPDRKGPIISADGASGDVTGKVGTGSRAWALGEGSVGGAPGERLGSAAEPRHHLRERRPLG